MPKRLFVKLLSSTGGALAATALERDRRELLTTHERPYRRRHLESSCCARRRKPLTWGALRVEAELFQEGFDTLLRLRKKGGPAGPEHTNPVQAHAVVA